MKSLLAIAALAAALSTAAFAADVKSTAPTPMTDAQMDAVTAGGQITAHLIIQQNSQVFHVNGKDSEGNVANGYGAYERNSITNPGTEFRGKP